MRSKLFVVLFATAVLAVAGAWVLHQTVLAEDQKDAKEAQAELGVYAGDISENTAERLDLPGTEGAYITGISWGGAAAEAGLLRGDVITAVDNKAVKSADELADIIQGYKPGDKVTVSFIRKGELQTLIVTLKESRRCEPLIRSHHMARPDIEKFVTVRPKIAALLERPRIGINYSELSEQLGSYFGVEKGKGVLVTEVFEDRPAAKAGMMAGDVIVSVDGKEIGNGSDLRTAIWKFEGKEGAAMDIVVIRKGQRMTLKVVPEKRDKASWDVYIPRIHEELAPAMEGLALEMGELGMVLDDLGHFDIDIPEIDIDIPEFDIHIPEIAAPPIFLHMDDFDGGFGCHLRIDSDGKVVFNDKEFESIKEFKEFIKSDEFKALQNEWNAKFRKKIEDKIDRVKALDRERVVI